MSALRRTTIAVALAAAIPVALGACSSSGGKQESASTAGGGAGVADTPSMTVAMITHQAPGDTFWDIIRKGAEAAAKKDNVKLEYTADPDATKQAQLIQAAIDKKVDGIAVTDPNTGAIGPAIKKAVAAGIPVTMFNAGGPDAMGLGALGYFGQGEIDAGKAVGERLVKDGAKNALCVIQEQGQQQLEDRCKGVTDGAAGAKVERILRDGRRFFATAPSALPASNIANVGTNKDLVQGVQDALALQDERQPHRRWPERPSDAAATIGIMAIFVALLMIGGEFDLSTGVAVTFSGLAAAHLA